MSNEPNEPEPPEPSDNDLSDSPMSVQDYFHWSLSELNTLQAEIERLRDVISDCGSIAGGWTTEPREYTDDERLKFIEVYCKDKVSRSTSSFLSERE